MLTDASIIRLIVSQAFAAYFFIILVPFKKPTNRSITSFLIGILIITFINALLISSIGMIFYIRFYFLTLVLPYFALLYCFSIYRGGKLIFAVLSVQVVGNVAIINGLMASYFIYGENHPLIDTVARILTYIIFLPIIFKFMRPTYLKMVEMLNKGWWILNSALILSYALAYFILFVPNPIFDRPQYFAHAYIGIFLSLIIYAIILFLFNEIQSKMAIEHDKQLLSTQVTSLAEQSAAITTIAYKDALTGVKNRYSLFRQLDQLIEQQQPFLVVFIDLDNLKEINDTYDHTKGDAYLKQFALAIQNTINDQGEVYRFAGDEFVCLMLQNFTHFNSDDFKKSIADKMDMDIPFLGMSIGLALHPKDGLVSDDLIDLADQAMYIEKKAKKNRR